MGDSRNANNVSGLTAVLLLYPRFEAALNETPANKHTRQLMFDMQEPVFNYSSSNEESHNVHNGYPFVSRCTFTNNFTLKTY